MIELNNIKFRGLDQIPYDKMPEKLAIIKEIIPKDKIENILLYTVLGRQYIIMILHIGKFFDINDLKKLITLEKQEILITTFCGKIALQFIL